MKNEILKIDWILKQHKSTKHMYDTYLPYEFHLRMVNNVGQQFKHLLDERDFYTVEEIVNPVSQVSLRSACMVATWGHDLIEDTRVSYNDVKDHLGQEVADIIYALTNEKGKTRKERANDKYYKGIRVTPGAVFVKLCDRIANLQYSKMTGSHMFEMYKKENDEFIVQLGYDDTNTHPYFEMFSYLVNLLNK